ncbi:calcineurin-like phosphoesterase family protein [Labilithrix luteola]|uniref:Calcineurin-like phosphoesterase family protein n=1 Tax=Labilithrix luteola TaxID=1391654 RepID=A0A0K1QGW1_9BACT|nr:hypothetical protein [Labilithrix luteola]AKV04675.1 calcineurin-like phosphoesterase family protein [Labilithrix luteola]
MLLEDGTETPDGPDEDAPTTAGDTSGDTSALQASGALESGAGQPSHASVTDEDDLPPASSAEPLVPIFLEPRGDRLGPLVFRHGAHPPFAIRWYGITSLFGHLRNFVARAIATESVDSRDWMRPNAPEELLRATVSVLRGGQSRTSSPDGDPQAGNGPLGTTKPAASLVEALDRPVWIDFVADTGDDRDVSAGVGEMLASTYECADDAGHKRTLPRGDLLVFGGDVAYPVATADEIYKRLVLPWNEQLRRTRASNRKRVVLGVPGNHDWYDGLDGFGRLFRRSVDEPFRTDDVDPTPKLGRKLRIRTGRKVGLVARQLHLDEVGGAYGLIVAFGRSVKAFFSGVGIRRRRRLVLRGYEPVQEASYFALPLAPGLDLFGADRQLGRVDFRQRSYFTRWRRAHADRAVLFVAGDPAMAYGLRNDPGARMLAACKLSLERDRIFYIAGDFHHYERRRVDRSMHVIAGGGGAFLHGTRIGPYPKPSGPPDAAYPNAVQCRKLVAEVPVRLTLFRAGALVHVALALLASLQLWAARNGTHTLVFTSIAMATALTFGLYFIAHQGQEKRGIAFVAAPFGVALGLLPMALRLSTSRLPAMAGDTAVIIASAFGGSFVFGIYLTILAVLGFEHQQAFTVLGHPGFKHFVRLCVHRDGRIEGWTVGKDDVLVKGPPALIDKFVWTPGPPEPPKPGPRGSRRPPAGS